MEFSEFMEFRESEKSLRHELGSALLHVSLWDSGIISISYTQEVLGSNPAIFLLIFLSYVLSFKYMNT